MIVVVAAAVVVVYVVAAVAVVAHAVAAVTAVEIAPLTASWITQHSMQLAFMAISL